jgi:hypothetical protein
MAAACEARGGQQQAKAEADALAAALTLTADARTEKVQERTGMSR